MNSSGSSKGVRMIWTVLVMVILAVASFISGIYVGTVTMDGDSGFVVIDDYGRTVRISGVPQRIVSVAPTPTEILFAVGAGQQVVGVDNYSDYPAVKVSNEGWNWLEANQDKLILTRGASQADTANTPPSVSPGGDIPF